MADAAVEFLLNNIKDLLLYHSHLITNNKHQIEKLETDIRFLNAFVKESQLKRRNDEGTKALTRRIRDIVYEVEDAIDALTTHALEKRLSSNFLRFLKSSASLDEIAEKVMQVIDEVERARFKLANLGVNDEQIVGKPEARPLRMKDVVGFKDVTEELINRLTKETDYFDVVCLIGMFGLGKTTLASKIFNDPAILYQFPVRIWLSISQEFSDKDIFLAILKEFTFITDDIRQNDDRTIARMVSDYLEKGSFLIVMDDVWTTSDWDRLRNALPNHNNKGKVLITSRIEDVGKYACSPRPPHLLRFFTQDESWELLRLEALRELECPPQLETVGRLIARDCEGLPLALVIIGGILATKYWKADLDATRKSWEEVSTHVSTYLNADRADQMKIFISPSYEKLPYHLRACFLYLGMFPEDYEIPASKLILLWIGEGFIQQTSDCSLEEIGEMYLNDLINRNLVIADKINYHGKVKTCRMHNAFRDFCRTEAGSEAENFLQEIKFVDGHLSPPISNIKKCRRLCVHSHFPEFISSKPFGPRVRSFISISKEEFILSSEDLTDILKAFQLLRVFDVSPLRFPKLSTELFKLLHVRYLSFSFTSRILPRAFNKLWNLQTLIVDTTSTYFDVKADILKLIQLRHFKTNASATLSKPSKDSKHGAELQTLGTISVESCTHEFCERACNLKKLGVRGKLALFLEGNRGSFDSLGRMKHLENLKLMNDLHPLPRSEWPLNCLPGAYKFPYRLRSLTLRATYLEWRHMSTIASLLILEVLKLKDNAFTGKHWVAVDGGFQRLQFLHINDTDLEVWDASSHHYPRLKGLVLRNCTKLRVVPIGLADIKSFQKLILCNTAVSSARKVQEEKKKAAAAFELSVFPPIID